MNEPYILVVVLKLIVYEVVRADELNVPELYPPRDIELAVVLLSIIAVSCASGKLASAPAPPEDVAQDDDPAHVVLEPTR